LQAGDPAAHGLGTVGGARRRRPGQLRRTVNTF